MRRHTDCYDVVGDFKCPVDEIHRLEMFKLTGFIEAGSWLNYAILEITD